MTKQNLLFPEEGWKIANNFQSLLTFETKLKKAFTSSEN